MGDTTKNNAIRSFSDAALAGWDPGPPADGYIAGHWKRHALRTQERLYGHNWTPDETFRHIYQMQETLPRYGCFEYPFNGKLDDPVLADAYRIISQWVNDTVPHLEVVPVVVTFMRDLPYKIHFSNYMTTMSQHFTLYKSIAQYIHKCVFSKGMGFWRQHSFQAWLDRQHPTIHAMLQNVETGLRHRLRVWFDADVCTHWNKMRMNALMYQTWPLRPPSYWWKWYANRPEFQSLFCNFHVDRRLALVLHLLADLDFSNENVVVALGGEHHYPHRGCKEDCARVMKIVAAENTKVPGEAHYISGESVTADDRLTTVPATPYNSAESEESEDENPYGVGPSRVIKLRRRPALDPVITGADRSNGLRGHISKDTYNSANNQNLAASYDNSALETIEEDQIYEDSSSSENCDTPYTTDSAPEDFNHWDNGGVDHDERSVTYRPLEPGDEIPERHSFLPINGLRSVADRPPTPYPRNNEKSVVDRLGASGPRANNTLSTNDVSTTFPETTVPQVISRPPTPHLSIGKLEFRHGAFVITNGVSPLDIGSPLVPIEESLSQTTIHLAVSEQSARTPIRDVEDDHDSSGDETFEDAIEHLSLD